MGIWGYLPIMVGNKCWSLVFVAVNSFIFIPLLPLPCSALHHSNYVPRFPCLLALSRFDQGEPLVKRKF